MLPTVLASLTDVARDYGVLALFVLIAVETMGIPVPGETALIAAAIFASQGHLSIEAVIVAAAAAAILGDNVGFAIGRKYGRLLLESDRGPFSEHRKKLLALGEPFFAKHGPKAVFLGRWVAGLRITAAWLAGANHMRWRTFTFYNALGGIAWATSVGLISYYLGHTAETIFKTAGLAGLGAAALLGVVAYAIHRVRRRRSAAAGAEPEVL
ncbi:MAG: DedA family protein [Solirubrobacterales bacterium]|nr:DedA family protein [Solirubrobacterales bacterium]